MKKIFAVLLVLVVVMSLCACKKNQSLDQSLEGKPSELLSLEEVKPISKEDLVPLEMVEPESYGELVPLKEITHEWEVNEDELIAPNGKKFKLPDYAGIMATCTDRCLLFVVKRSELWLCDQNTGLTQIAEDQIMVNYVVAYDTVYWENWHGEGWALDWKVSNEEYLVCDEVLGVSVQISEGEGFIVVPEKANNFAFGIPTYTPGAIEPSNKAELVEQFYEKLDD